MTCLGEGASYYHNEDLAPVPPERRKWTTWNYMALWAALTFNVATYVMITSFLQGGLSYASTVMVVLVGSIAILPAIILNGRPGSQYGLPFPVLARAAFGMRGAQVPALLRAFVACGWFGIQAWIGGTSLHALTAIWWPGVRGMRAAPFVAFAVFWGINVGVAWMGIEALRRLLSLKSVILVGVCLAMLVWALEGSSAHSLDLNQRPEPSIEVTADFWAACMTAVISCWSTLSLNIPDFTRYAKHDRSQALGQAVGLPATMVGFAVVAVYVTAASAHKLGTPIYDPVILISRSNSPTLQAFAQLCVAFSVLSTNLAANVVGPANDFANLAPKYISYRTGCLITGCIGVALCPWKLLASADALIYDWLVAYGSLLGPLLGVLLADYYVVKRQRLHVEDLYSDSPTGRYWYRNGVHAPALIALFVGIAPNVPGLVSSLDPHPRTDKHMRTYQKVVSGMYAYSWFIGVGVAFVTYTLLCVCAPENAYWGVYREEGSCDEKRHTGEAKVDDVDACDELDVTEYGESEGRW